MRIWIVNPFDAIPGEGVRPGRYWTLAETLAGRGHEVIWWSSNFSHRFKRKRIQPDLNGLGFKVELVPTRPYRQNISVARLINHYQFAKGFYAKAYSLIKSNRTLPPERIIVSVPPLQTPHVAFKLRKKWGCKVILDIQDAWPETFYRLIPDFGKLSTAVAKIVFSPWYIQIQRAYAMADGISGVAKTYINIANADKRRVRSHIAPLGIMLSDLEKYMEKMNCVKSSFKFVYLGSMSTNYDLETVVYATSKLVKRGYDFQVMLAGMGPMEEHLKELVSSLNLSSTVVFKGFLNFSGVANLLSQSDVALNCIFPESYIALPNKIGDYLGAGLPVINSIPGELKELLHKNNAGIYYLAGDIESLTTAMEYYLNNPDKAELHGHNARKLAKEMFDREKTYPKYAQFVESI